MSELPEKSANNSEEKKCPTCGADIEADERVCKACGELIVGSSRTRTDPLIGRVIDGKYRILERLSGGGMGAVYRAEHAMMNRIVAVKVLHRHLAEGVEEDQFLRRFQREARLASKINHPNAITIYDFGIHGDQAYLVMQYLEGRSLKTILDEEGNLALGRVVRLIEQIGSALLDAHSLDIVHRDLKPDNIMVSLRKDGDEVATVLDFGIAKVLTSETGKSSSVTKTGRIIGTPQYMSPEQVLGHQVDKRTDVYALGIIVYELLCGSPPFDSPSLMRLIMKHVNEPPIPLLQRQPNLEIPPGVEAVVMRSIRKKPEERYQSIEEMLAELRAAAGGAHIEMPPIEDAELAMRTIEAPVPEQELGQPEAPARKSRRSLLGMAALGVVGALSVLLWMVFSGGPPSDESVGIPRHKFVGVGVGLVQLENRIAIRTVVSGSPAEQGGLREGDSLLEINGRSLEGVDSGEATEMLRGVDGSAVTIKLQRAGVAEPRLITIIRGVVETGPVETALVQSRELWEAGQLEEAVEMRRQAAELHPDNPNAHLYYAELLHRSGKVDLAIDSFNRAIELNPNHPSAHYELGYSLLTLGRNEEAVAALLEAIRIDPENLNAVSNVAYGYERMGRYDLALPHLREAARLDRTSASLRYRLGLAFSKLGLIYEAVHELQTAVNSDPKHGLSRMLLGGLYSQLGRHEDAVTQLTAAVELTPDNARGHFLLAEAYREYGRSNEAVAAYKDALKLNPNFRAAHLQLGTAYMQIRDFDAAEGAFREAIRLDAQDSRAYNNLGWALNNLGRFQEAVIVLGEAIRLAAKNAQAHFNLGTAYANLGKFEEAAEVFQLAVELSPNYLEAHFNLGKTYERLGKFELARRHYEEVMRISPQNAQAAAALSKLSEMTGP